MEPHTLFKALRTRYRDRAIEPDTLFLLAPNDALALLDDARSAGLLLAGVEGFAITDAGAYQPCQDFSNDVSDFGGRTERFFTETKALIWRGASQGIRFQIVLEMTDADEAARTGIRYSSGVDE